MLYGLGGHCPEIRRNQRRRCAKVQESGGSRHAHPSAGHQVDGAAVDGDAPSAELLALLDDRGVAGKQLHIFGDRANVAISRENLHDEARLREALESRLRGRARLVDGLAAVSVVGAGINVTYTNVRAGSEALSHIRVEAAGVATSSFRITWMIPRARTEDVVRALHQRFIESERPLLP